MAYASFSYFQIVGIGLLLIGVWIEVESKDYEALNNDLFIPSIMMMSVGFIIIINSNFNFNFLGGSIYDLKQAIIGSPTKRHLNGVSLACR